MKKLSITSDLFMIPWEDKYIIYAPLKGLAFLISSGMVNLLNRIKAGEDLEGFDGNEDESLKPFKELGIVNGKVDKLPLPQEEEFLPFYVTIFLTTRCNLRCIYCYASGGEKDDLTISLGIARSAIDLIIKNALLKKEKKVGIGFHGGGEPTLAWVELRHCVEYAQRKASEKGLKTSLSIATNGIIEDRKLDWIMENFSGLNLSLDGAEYIQDYNRPMADGGGSFCWVMKTVKRMNEGNFPYGIRATITDKSVRYMDEIITFFGENCKARQIHFEPSFNCGRCIQTGIGSPAAEEFIDGFRKAEEIAERYGMPIYYSGARIGTIAASFCRASSGSFCLTPDGDITSCYEVCSKDDPRSEAFYYGKFDWRKRDFVIFKDKLANLRKRTIHNIAYCEDCFCKFHCAGDCPAKASDFKDLTKITNSTRCQINQTLTLDKIIKILQKGENINRPG
jgi:uncharacterized protein